jgi:hypothetical protein
MENPAIKNGVFMGIASILFTMILYLIDSSMIFGGVAYVGMLIPVYFMWKSATEERANNEGFLTFGEGFKAAFLAAVIGGLFAQLFSYVLINFIDPSLVDVLREQSVEAAEKMIAMFGENEEAAEAMREAMEEQDFTPTLGKTLLGYLGTLVIPFSIIALIIAAITKKQDKSFA